jgi:hypothetical protein
VVTRGQVVSGGFRCAFSELSTILSTISDGLSAARTRQKGPEVIALFSGRGKASEQPADYSGALIHRLDCCRSIPTRCCHPAGVKSTVFKSRSNLFPVFARGQKWPLRVVKRLQDRNSEQLLVAARGHSRLPASVASVHGRTAAGRQRHLRCLGALGVPASAPPQPFAVLVDTERRDAGHGSPGAQRNPTGSNEQRGITTLQRIELRGCRWGLESTLSEPKKRPVKDRRASDAAVISRPSRSSTSATAVWRSTTPGNSPKASMRSSAITRCALMRLSDSGGRSKSTCRNHTCFRGKVSKEVDAGHAGHCCSVLDKGSSKLS